MQKMTDSAVARIAAWCKRTGYEMGSHVYPRGYILASRTIGPDARDWRVVRWNGDKRRVDVITDALPLRTLAVTQLGLTLAEQGVSPKSVPERIIVGVPFYPRASHVIG